MTGGAGPSSLLDGGLEVEHAATDALVAVRREWDGWADEGQSPFLLTAWLSAWVATRARRTSVLLVRDGAGEVAGGAVFRESRHGKRSATDEHTGTWTAVGRDERAHEAVWRGLALSAGWRVALDALPPGPTGADAARSALEAAGFTVATRRFRTAPRIYLPASGEEVLARAAPGLRKRFRRQRRALSRLGDVRMRTSSRDSLDDDFEAFLAIEASGWKGRAGTAIASLRSTEALYRRFARAAADDGRLRLQLLEVDGRPVAGDLSVVAGTGIHSLKCGYDEALAVHSPGLVLLGSQLQWAADEGCSYYDMLGPLEPFKQRWGGEPGTSLSLRAYRGKLAAPACTYEERVQPALASLAAGWCDRRARPGDRGRAGPS